MDTQEIDLLFLDIELNAAGTSRTVPLDSIYYNERGVQQDGTGPDQRKKLLISKYKYQYFVKAYLRFLKKGAVL